MSDYNRSNNNNHRDDIDNFFAQFDEPVKPRNEQSRRSATIHGRNTTAQRYNGDSSPRSNDAPRPQSRRQTSYRTESDREAAKAARKAIANNQPGARRNAQRHAQSSTSTPTPQSKAVRKSETPNPDAMANRSSRKKKHDHKSKTNVKAAKRNILRKAEHIADEAIHNDTIAKIQNGGSGNGPIRHDSGKKSIIKLVIALGLTLVMAVGIYTGITMVFAPNINTDDIYAQLSQRSILYDNKGNEVDNLYYADGNRTILDYNEIPENMVNAVVSIEDKKFWKHNGFNFIRMLGAIKDSVTGGGQISGTSTITQQLARNVYLADIKSRRDIGRKIQEMYITIVLEKNLSKEKIMEAYLNSIYLGFNSYGIQAASQSYFNKDAKDMDTLECAALASLPKSPDSFALVKTTYDGTNPSSLPVVAQTSTATYLYNGELSQPRRDLTLQNMCDMGYITQEQKDKALNSKLKKHIKLGDATTDANSSYFTDYCIKEIVNDMIDEYGITEADAKNKLYTTGMEIYTTMDSNIQKICEEEFANDNNYSGLAYIRKNYDGDLIGKDGAVLSHSYSYYLDDNDNFLLKKGEYKMNSDGSMTIYAGKRLALYDTEVNGATDISIEFKSMYLQENGKFYFIESGALSIPQQYKSSDKNGNCVISAQFFQDKPDFFQKNDGGYLVKKGNYSIKQKIRQPQAATVILENETGEIKAMMGGRGATGKQLFNRATSTRQPGSNIKPIGVYGPALQMSKEYADENKKMDLDTSEGSDWGDYITAGSMINDKAMQYGGKTWPKNWYSGFKGSMTLRKSVEQSVNVNAVKCYLQIGSDYSASMLKKVGITSIDEDGAVNDLNPAALALGGMTRGISPLEMTAAYAVFPSGGVYRTPISYTKVLNANGDVLFEKKAKEEQVYDEGVAWIMTDILRTVVSHGLGSAARLYNQPVGGKTGTTSDSYDLWFTGFTPQYTSAMWMGNDINIQLSAGSSQSARFWRAIMSRVCEDLPTGQFKEMPSNVERRGGEYYIKGTYSKVKKAKKDEDKTKETKKETTTAPATKPETKPPTTPAPTTTEQPSDPSEETAPETP